MIRTLAAGGADQPGTIWAGTLPGGLFVSRDHGASWALVDGAGGQGRVPADAHLAVTRTRDGGAVFETLDAGLGDGPRYDLIYRHALVTDATGRRLAMGSTTGNLWVSGDGGARWEAVSTGLPPIAALAFA